MGLQKRTIISDQAHYSYPKWTGITLIKAFIEVANSGYFIAACDRLSAMQSAVSLRIQRLEDSLGQPLFTRSQTGAILTSAGVQFVRYAL